LLYELFPSIYLCGFSIQYSSSEKLEKLAAHIALELDAHKGHGLTKISAMLCMLVYDSFLQNETD